MIDVSEVKGKKVLTSRWVFRIKEDGRYKARLVVRGCQQRFGIDFFDTYSPVVGADTLRVLLAHAVKNNLKINTFDVKNAFLHGFVDEEIYMSLPEGYGKHSGKICKLNKALYGLRQASASWQKRLVTFLKEEGLTPMKTDRCVFLNQNISLILAIHVDDGLLLGADKTKMSKLLKRLEKEFEITTTNNPNSFLGMELQISQGRIKITQKSYIENILKKFNMTGAKPMSTPLSAYKPADLKKPDKPPNFPFREAVGSLLYLSTKTRPDISFAVGYCSRQMEHPDDHDVINLKRIMRYLKGSIGSGISYSADSTNELKVFCDSDHAGDPATTKSTSGYVMYYGGGPISWRSRKQPTTADHSTEAEFVAAAESCRELIYVKAFIEELTKETIEAEMLIDNASTIELIKTGVMNRRRKHIDVKYHFLHEKYVEGLMKLSYCPTDIQIADLLTKPLGPTKFNFFQKKLVT